MIIKTRFLQAVTAANKPPYQTEGTHTNPASRSSNPITWPAVLITASLHLVWLAMPSEDTSKGQITPLRPIMVNWIDVPVAKLTAAPTPKAPLTSQPRLEKPKPKTRFKAVNPQSAVATQRQTASDMSVPFNEAVFGKEITEAHEPTPLTPVVDSASQDNQPADSGQTPTILPSLNADSLNNPPPAYPPQSRQFGEQGKVMLRLLVSADGGVEQVNLRKSGYQRLDRAAQESVKRWRFVPVKRGNQAVTTWVVVPISFSLEG